MAGFHRVGNIQGNKQIFHYSGSERERREREHFQIVISWVYQYYIIIEIYLSIWYSYIPGLTHRITCNQTDKGIEIHHKEKLKFHNIVTVILDYDYQQYWCPPASSYIKCSDGFFLSSYSITNTYSIRYKPKLNFSLGILRRFITRNMQW